MMEYTTRPDGWVEVVKPERRAYMLEWANGRYYVRAIIRIEGHANVWMEATVYCQDNGYHAFRLDDGTHYRSRGQEMRRVKFTMSAQMAPAPVHA